MFKKIKGFTLGEVMLAMALLGFLATLTLRTVGTAVQHNTRNAEFKTAYSKLDLALKSVLAEHSVAGSCYACPTEDDAKKYGLNINGTCTAKTNCETLEKYIVKELGVIKTCNNESDDSCIPPRYRTSTDCFKDFSKGKSFIMSNGMIIITDDDKSFTQFAIDVNGKKGPNQWGEDVFTLAVTAADTTLSDSTLIVNDVSVLPPSACLLGSNGKGGKSSAVMLEEIANYKAPKKND